MLKQEFSQHMFDELLFFFFPTKIELSYKAKNHAVICITDKSMPSAF